MRHADVIGADGFGVGDNFANGNGLDLTPDHGSHHA